MGDFPSDNFPRGNFPKVRIGPLRHHRLQWGRALKLGWARGRAPRLEQAGGQVVWLGQALEVAGWGIAYLGSGHLRKYPWEVDTSEKFFGKVFKSLLNFFMSYVNGKPEKKLAETNIGDITFSLALQQLLTFFC